MCLGSRTLTASQQFRTSSFTAGLPAPGGFSFFPVRESLLTAYLVSKRLTLYSSDANRPLTQIAALKEC